MAERSAKALAAVEKVLKKKPKADTPELRAAAEKADASTKKLNPRSFNARYLLPTRRKLGLLKKSTKRKRRKKAPAKQGRPKARRRTTGRRRLHGRALARRLVQERDRLVQDSLVKGTDQHAAYELGASIDEYLDKLQVALRGS